MRLRGEGKRTGLKCNTSKPYQRFSDSFLLHLNNNNYNYRIKIHNDLENAVIIK